MGWWSANIMGGDPPYDAHSWVWTRALQLGGHEDKDYSWVLDQEKSCFDHDWDILRECLTAENVETMFDEIQTFKGVSSEEDIHAQVLATVMLGAGVPIPEKIKAPLISLIASDEWATESPERAMYVLDLVRRVESHEADKPQELPTKGLMECMGEMLGGHETRNPANGGITLDPEEVSKAQYILGTMKHG